MKLLLCILPLLLALASCTADELPEPQASDCDPAAVPVYDGEVALIIEQSCAYSGCHLGGAPGVYNSYEGLRPDLESGTFRERTINLREDPVRGMPPSYAPEGRPQSLSEDEINLINCWLEAGHPES